MVEPAEIAINGNVTGFRRAMQELTQSAKEAVGAVESSFGGLGRVFDGVRGHIASLGVAVSAVGFASMIKGAIDAADNMNDMAQRTGISVETLFGLKLMADQSGTSLEGLGNGLKKLSVNLVDAAAGNKEMSAILKALGISGTDSKEAMYRLADIMATLPDGAQKTALAIKILGKNGEELIPLLNQGGEEMRKMAEKSERLGNIMADTAPMADQFNDQLAELKVQSSALGMSMAKDMLPALNGISAAMREAAKEGGMLTAVWVGLGGVGAALFTDEFATPAKKAEKEIEKLRFEIDRLKFNKEQLAGGGLLHKWLYGNGKDIDAEIQSKMKQIDALKKSMETPPKPKDKPTTPAVDVTKVLAAGKTASSGSSSAPKVPMPDSYMQYYEAALAEEKRLAYERDAIRGYSKEQELAYWQTLLAHAALKEKDRVAIMRKASGLTVEIKREEAKQKQELDSEVARSSEELQLGGIEGMRAAEQAALDLGQITKMQFIAMEEQHEQQRYEIQRASLEARLKLLEQDPNTNPVEKARINNQILALEQQHQIKRIQLAGQAAQENGQIWKTLGARMTGLWDKGVQAMMNGTLTWRNAMRAAGTEVVSWFANEVVGKEVKLWLFGEAAKTGATQTGVLARGAAESAASAKSIGLWAMTAVKNIMTSAWEAMAGAWKAIVGIQYVGPVLAPIAAGVAFAGVSALAANVMSAEGGYDIPRGINPITQLHEEEMVLPKAQANVIRDMADGGSGGSGGSTTNHYHISTMDSKSFERFANDNKRIFAGAIKSAHRDGFK